MKKTIILAIVIVIISSKLSAQKTVRFGITGNFNYSFIENLSTGTEGIAGFKVGGTADISLSTKFSLQPSLLYAAKGGKGALNIPAIPRDMRTNISVSSNYIEMPVLIAFKYSIPSSKTKFVINAGPYVAYGISGKTKIDSSDGGVDAYGHPWGYRWNTFNAKEDDFTSDSMNKFDWGISSGVGFEFNKFSVMAKLDIGFKDIYPDGYFDEIAKKRTNHSLGVSVGYLF